MVGERCRGDISKQVEVTAFATQEKDVSSFERGKLGKWGHAAVKRDLCNAEQGTEAVQGQPQGG